MSKADTRNHIVAGNNDRGPCLHCGRLTRWIELSFEAWLCPGPCSDALWADYAEASRPRGATWREDR
jgi:hypothetical protein